jgi:uncharacterized protein YdaU (DUF1376 family)
MAKDKPPSFQFYPRDFLADVAGVLTNEQIGRYTLSLCRSWLSDTPGVASESDWQAWMSYSDEEWVAVRPKLVRLFKLLPSGSWKQKRMVEERDAQIRRFDSARKGAAATNERRWGSVANDSPPDSLAITPASASASASSKNLESTHLSDPVGPDVLELLPPEPKPPQKRDTQKAADSKDWLEGFNEFWTAYPHRDNSSRKEALKVWSRLQPADYRREVEPGTTVADDLFGSILEALEESKRAWKRDRTEEQHIPHHSVWLNKELWRNHAQG